jgi:hypothetical protein
MANCIHNKKKQRCFICDGTSLCLHLKRKDECRICSDKPIHLLMQKMIRNCRYADKSKNLYDEKTFIDYKFVEEIIKLSYDLCFYCGKTVQYIHNDHSLATIERMDNSLGHTTENCVIACRTCNLGHMGTRFGF